MRSVPIALALTVLGCDPAPTDLGGPEVDGTGTGSEGDSEDPGPGEPGMLIGDDAVQGRVGLDLSIAPDGTVYVGGHFEGTAEETVPLWLARFDVEGTMSWEETIDAVAGGVSVSATADGVYVSVNGLDERRLERRTSDGDIVWSTTDLTNATATPDGGFVTADREGDGTFLRKLDADRVEQWATLFEDVDPDTTTFVSSIDIAADGRIWAIGTDVLETPGPTWIVLLDGDGVVQWEPQTFHTPQERTIRVDATDDGAVVLRPAPDGRAWGFADDGTHEWSYTDGHVDAAHAFAAVASGGFVVARMVRLPEGDPTCQHDLSECATHIDVRRVDANEVVLWDATTAVANWTMDAEIAPDGTFVLLGLDVDNSTGAIATVLLRYGV